MKERYLFKARGQCSKFWHYGMLTFCGDCTCHIKDNLYNEKICDTSTLCQCTGKKDKNNKLIWENDICNYYNPKDKDGIGIIKNGYVLWIDGTISMRHKMTPLFYLQCKDEWEVIGNIFDNPELLNKREETCCKEESKSDLER